MTKLKVGLVGFGFSGQTFHAPLICSVPELELSYVVSRNREAVNAILPKVSVVPTMEEVLERPEVQLIVLATPNDLHFDQAKLALLSQKHVVVDKPFTTTSAQAAELLALSKRQGRVLSVFHNRRWDSDYLTVKKLIKQNVLGEIKQMESHFDRYKPDARDRWKEQASRGGGIWNDLGSHLLDQVLHLFGKPDSLWTDVEIQRNQSQGPDYFHAVLRYQKMRVILHSTSYALAEAPRFSIYGTKGNFIKFGFDPQEEHLKKGLMPDSTGYGLDQNSGRLTYKEGSEVKTKTIPSEIGNYRDYYVGVARAILNQEANPVSAEEALQVVELLELPPESADKR